LEFKAAAPLPHAKALRAFSCNVVGRTIMKSGLGMAGALLAWGGRIMRASDLAERK
jgi:hypothetical protein